MDREEEWCMKHGWKKVKGIKFGEEFCGDVKDRDLEEYYIEATKFEDLEDFDISQVEYWVRDDDEGEICFEDIDALIEHIEDETGEEYEEEKKD